MAPGRVNGSTNPKAVVCTKFTTVYLDSKLEQVLDPYVNDGTTQQYGSVLFVHFPDSRPRKMAPGIKANTLPWPQSCRVPKTKIDGCYILKTVQLKLLNPMEIKQLEEQSNSATVVANYQALNDNLSTEKPLGSQLMSIKASSGSSRFRAQHNLKQWPTAFGRKIVHAASQEKAHECLNWNNITINAPGAVVPAQKNLADLIKVVYNHRGTSVHWIVVPPSESQKFETYLKDLFKAEIQDPCCSQFVKHLSLWIKPELLKEWGIGYINIHLDPEQMVVFYPSCYYWGMSTGFSIMEAKYAATSNWNIDSYDFCEKSNKLCKAVEGNLFFKISQQEINAVVADVAQKQSSKHKRNRVRIPALEMSDNMQKNNMSSKGDQSASTDEHGNLTEPSFQQMGANLNNTFTPPGDMHAQLTNERGYRTEPSRQQMGFNHNNTFAPRGGLPAEHTPNHADRTKRSFQQTDANYNNSFAPRGGVPVEPFNKRFDRNGFSRQQMDVNCNITIAPKLPAERGEDNYSYENMRFDDEYMALEQENKELRDYVADIKIKHRSMVTRFAQMVKELTEKEDFIKYLQHQLIHANPNSLTVQENARVAAATIEEKEREIAELKKLLD